MRYLTKETLKHRHRQKFKPSFQPRLQERKN